MIVLLAAWIPLALIERGAAQLLDQYPGQALGLESTERGHHFLTGRALPGKTSAAALAAAREQHLRLAGRPRAVNLTTLWAPVGPEQVLNPVYGEVTGRVTALLIDPADTSGNTVYVGTTGGGVWKSTNAAGPAAAVSFAPLTDTLPVFSPSFGASVVPSLSIGSLAKAGGAVLAGTGDPNDATDSYYGSGILRSTDGGLNWTLASSSNDGVYGFHPFAGLSVAGLAASTANPNHVVAAMTQSPQALAVGAELTPATLPGLYSSTDGGVTWRYAVVYDSATAGNPTDPNVVQWAGVPQSGTSATSVVWNPVRQLFFAAMAGHGYYQSADGANWTRLVHQPGVGLTLANCHTLSSAQTPCPLGRGVLAVQPVTGDLFALTVDPANNDQGLYQDVCNLQNNACSSATVTFGTKIDTGALEAGSGSQQIVQGDYDLALAAASIGTDTILYVGTIDLFRCSLAAGCVLRDTTNALNGCATPAGVAGAQHAIAASGSLVLTGNDGGLWRSTDAIAETGGVCSATDANHFDNLNGGLGSLAEVVSFAEDPYLPGTLIAGLGALGSAGSGTALGPSGLPAGAWNQLSTGEGGTVAIDPVNPMNWYLSTGPGISIARCGYGIGCGLNDFAQPSIAAAQVDGDAAAIHAPWLLDPQAASQILLGTCRAWRGPAIGATAFGSSGMLSAPFADPSATACPASLPAVRSLAAGGPANAAAASPNQGSEVLYAGLQGFRGTTSGLYGHLFATSSGNTATGTSAWTDISLSPVTNALAGYNAFNPESLDVSSVVADPHDASGKTVYATLQGFSSAFAGTSTAYRSTDGGAHWIDITSNLPNAPANSLLVDPNSSQTVYIALDTGVYVTTNVTSCATSSCWSVFGVGLPNSPVTQLAAAGAMPTGDGRQGELRAATYGRGIWQIPLVSAAAPSQTRIALNPASVTFPAQQTGTLSTFATVTVTNTGTATLIVTNVAASGDFMESDHCAGTSVAVSASCTVSLQFDPAAVGTRTGVLTVYGNVAGGQATVPLSGIGTAPSAIVLTPSSLQFPATPLGATAGPLNITVANTGGNSATLQPVTATGDFSLSANSCGGGLAPQNSCTVSVTFTPSALGSRGGLLTVADDAGTQVAPLSGIGGSPATDALAPFALSFAPQLIGTASAAQLVTLTNNGDQTLDLIAPQITGDFTVVSNCGASLPGHSSCAFTVVFVPGVAGLESGSLTVSDALRGQTVTLTGTGLAPAGVSLSPRSGLTFAASAVGQQSPAQTVTLTNNGGLPLALASLAATGDFQVGANTCGTALAAASSCIVQVLFTATQGGSRSGTLSFVDSAANSPQTLALTGTGVDFSLIASGSVSASVASGQTANYLLLLQANAGVPGNAALTCSGMPSAAFCTVSPATPTLSTAGGTVITVTVTTGQAHARLADPFSHPGFWLAMLGPVGYLASRRTRRRLLFLCLFAGLAGCGAGRTIPAGGGVTTTPIVATPPGTYTIAVAGSSAGLVRSVNLGLVVQ
jgi:hypothetical protein